MFNKPLFILEMANNHQGSVTHGKNIISALKSVCEPYMGLFNFAVKFQYRNLDTFIHPDYLNSDLKNVKRFRETALTPSEFLSLKESAEKEGFYTLCTPFDEPSVDLIAKHNYSGIKIASCSFSDWQLLEKIAEKACELGKPVIASCAGASLETVCKVVSFFKNRAIDFSLEHCVAEYPSENEVLKLNRIDLLKSVFPDVRIGFSTHENPDNMFPVQLAIAKGAVIFEKHVGLPTEDIELNGYSANPEQVAKWISAAKIALEMCGDKACDYAPTNKEAADLNALKRGVFAKQKLSAGEVLSPDNIFLAFPCQDGQLTADDLSKYAEHKLINEVAQNASIATAVVTKKDTSETIRSYATKIAELINKSGVVIPNDSECELSHHYGVDKFLEIGAAIINCINREYCKKILVLLPGQANPEHYHKLKEETFTVLYGDIELRFNDQVKKLKKGESLTIERELPHSFSSVNGCVFEEVSTTHSATDSYYGDIADEFSTPRKTKVYLTEEFLSKCK